MENNTKDPIIDWILQLDTNTTTTTFEGDTPLFSTNIISTTNINGNGNDNDNNRNNNNFIKSGLFQLYLDDGVQKINNDTPTQQIPNKENQQLTFHSQSPLLKEEDAAEEDDDDEDMLTVLTQLKKSKKVRPHATEPLSGRLDFRPTMTDQVPESQLKSMTPKERRQLRNKISARNFRNRRKQYITTIEEELDKYKDENKKLHSELATIREKMNKLREENKQLKLDLVLYQENIKPTTTTTINHLSSNQNIQSIPSINNSVSTIALPSFELSSPSDAYHTSDSSDSPSDLNMFDDFNIQQFSLSSSQQPPSQPQQQQLSTTTPSQFWDLSTLPEFNIHDMYLSHAMMPHWNINNVLSKSNEQTSSPINNNNNTNVMEIFQKYPLLAPALMSIVVGHTMTLSANDLLKLNYSTTNVNHNKDMVMVGNNNYPTIHGLSDKQTLKIWELLQPITENNNDNNNVKLLSTTTIMEDEENEGNKESIINDNDNDNNINNDGDDQQKSDNRFDIKEIDIFCPMTWAHRCLKTYVCSYVHSYIEQYRLNNLENQQNNYNNMTSSYRRPCTLTAPICKQLKRAKERFVPVS